tara:strand:- start:788 stop:1009 length:222 start_codon:yes stop_codon:yes gene_type:complete
MHQHLLDHLDLMVNLDHLDLMVNLDLLVLVVKVVEEEVVVNLDLLVNLDLQGKEDIHNINGREFLLVDLYSKQ